MATDWSTLPPALLKMALMFVILLAALTILYFAALAIRKLTDKGEIREEAAAVPEGKTAVQLTAPGSCGALKLYDTPDKDAALIMAIVADRLGKPLNELRFLSIKKIDNAGGTSDEV